MTNQEQSWESRLHSKAYKINARLGILISILSGTKSGSFAPIHTAQDLQSVAQRALALLASEPTGHDDAVRLERMSQAITGGAWVVDVLNSTDIPEVELERADKLLDAALEDIYFFTSRLTSLARSFPGIYEGIKKAAGMAEPDKRRDADQNDAEMERGLPIIYLQNWLSLVRESLQSELTALGLSTRRIKDILAVQSRPINESKQLLASSCTLESTAGVRLNSCIEGLCILTEQVRGLPSSSRLISAQLALPVLTTINDLRSYLIPEDERRDG